MALEEAAQESRYEPVRRTIALRLALAYLWALGARERSPFDRFWTALGEDAGIWRFDHADRALEEIYADLGLRRDHELAMRIWQKVYARRPKPGETAPRPDG
ncbi:hypothetical protein [Sphingosinicella sp. BN140058]|uniref:hypothetical protein n=1 Tax=Sphingosinicella sp. BN140058 TaxID=1892855 RepID=UPI0010102430|nr:hypothetical protein [Sphingosinicella sp. BN140058]QAY78192.1 hypothetical protein ETR14_17900 [Sphingosinicella sp. BN140058]